MKQHLKSRTIRFNMIMTALGAFHGSVHLLQPFFSQEVFNAVFLILAVVVPVGNMYLRTITTKPIGEL